MNHLIVALIVIAVLVALPYALWTDYICVMALKRQRDGWGLNKVSKALGMTVLVRGMLLDFLVNVIHASIILREFPKEMTVTKRLDRHIQGNTSRAALCLAIRSTLLDGFDPAGIHR